MVNILDSNMLHRMFGNGAALFMQQCILPLLLDGETHICCMQYFLPTQMAAPTLQFYRVSSPHLACISSHILPGV